MYSTAKVGGGHTPTVPFLNPLRIPGALSFPAFAFLACGILVIAVQIGLDPLLSPEGKKFTTSQ